MLLLPLATSNALAETPRIEEPIEEYVFERSWGGEGNVLITPQGVAVGLNNKIYVANANLHRITIFDPVEKTYQNFGSFGYGNGLIEYPRGIAVDADGNILVSSSCRLDKFTAEGTYISGWGNCGPNPVNLSRQLA